MTLVHRKMTTETTNRVSRPAPSRRSTNPSTGCDREEGIGEACAGPPATSGDIAPTPSAGRIGVSPHRWSLRLDPAVLEPEVVERQGRRRLQSADVLGGEVDVRQPAPDHIAALVDLRLLHLGPEIGRLG